jgi:hypothetical protein
MMVMVMVMIRNSSFFRKIFKLKKNETDGERGPKGQRSDF